MPIPSSIRQTTPITDNVTRNSQEESTGRPGPTALSSATTEEEKERRAGSMEAAVWWRHGGGSGRNPRQRGRSLGGGHDLVRGPLEGPSSLSSLSDAGNTRSAWTQHILTRHRSRPSSSHLREKANCWGGRVVQGWYGWPVQES